MTSSIHIPSTLLGEIELLMDSNWHTFNTQMITVLASNNSDDIITSNMPKSTAVIVKNEQRGLVRVEAL